MVGQRGRGGRELEGWRERKLQLGCKMNEKIFPNILSLATLTTDGVQYFLKASTFHELAIIFLLIIGTCS